MYRFGKTLFNKLEALNIVNIIIHICKATYNKSTSIMKFKKNFNIKNNPGDFTKILET